MSERKPVIAILDVGKTNKKLLLFDEDYRVVDEQSVQMTQTTDEDGDPCEDIKQLRNWVSESIRSVVGLREFEVKAINVAAYGASFVHLDKQGELLTPLYDYRKPYPLQLSVKFYETHGGKEAFSLATASPVLGSLNSGMQLYRLKEERYNLFTQVHYSLHLPQYLTWIMTGEACSEITSIGCHTGLWDFQEKRYHNWVYAEGIAAKFPPLFSFDKVLPMKSGNHSVNVGMGLHDSSAALIPYLAYFKEPFTLLSTGTWGITLSPFNNSHLTADELRKDCLCYLDYRGNPVKSSRLFAGNDHEVRTRQLAEQFHVQHDFYKTMAFNHEFVQDVKALHGIHSPNESETESPKNFQQAYHRLMLDIVAQQASVTRLVISRDIPEKRIFVDGGFSRNSVFMNLLALAFKGTEVFAASLPQATALGAALAIHQHWNFSPLPSDLIQLNRYYAPSID